MLYEVITGIVAATGLSGRDRVQNMPIRRFSIQLGGEAVRVGQALGFRSYNFV